MTDPITQMAAMTGWMRQQREKQAPRPGPTMEAWRARIPQDLEELNAPRRRKLPSEMTQDELIDMASDLAMPMAGTTRKVGAKVLAKAAENAALPRLSALHNTDAAKLEKSLKLGGMPVPSIAVVPENVPFDEFGDITLIGKRSLGDPRQTRVFSDDVYSPTVPAPSYKKPSNKAIQEAWKGATGQYGSRFGDDVFRYAEDGDFDTAIRMADRSDELKMAWAKARGIQGDFRAISDDLYADPAKMTDFQSFVRSTFAPIMGEPLVKIGGRAVPYELDNIAEAMSKSTKNAQSTMVYGPGKVRSAHAKQYKDLEKMRAAAANIRPASETREMAQAARDKLVESASEIAPFSQYSTWTGMDDAMKAFSAPRTVPLDQSLARVDIRNVPPEKVAAARASLDEFLSVPTNYFESKPARGVRFDEFAGAVVPEWTPDALVDALRSHGIAVEKYADKLGRPDVVAKLRKALADGGQETLFAALLSVGMGGAVAQQRGERRGIQPL